MGPDAAYFHNQNQWRAFEFGLFHEHNSFSETALLLMCMKSYGKAVMFWFCYSEFLPMTKNFDKTRIRVKYQSQYGQPMK